MKCLDPLWFLFLCSGVHQQRVNPESLLLEVVKQVKVSDLEDDILELPEDDFAAANNQSVNTTRTETSQNKYRQITQFIDTFNTNI